MLSKKIQFTVLSVALLFLISPVFAQIQAITDPLRNFTNALISLDFLARHIVLLLSAFIFFIAWKAYTQAKSQKLLLIAIAFGVFTLKWVLQVLDLYFSPGTFFPNHAENIAELVILLSLFFALFKK